MSMKYFDAAQQFLGELEDSPLRYWNYRYWAWAGTHYRDYGSIDDLKMEVLRYLRRNQIADSSRWASEVELNLRAIAGLPSWQEMPAEVGSGSKDRFRISVQNGVLDLEPCLDGEEPLLSEHCEEWFSVLHLPFPYEPGAKCPRWLAFLNEVMQGDKELVHLIQEWFGYCCLPDTSFEKAMFWEGRGRNGKSQAIQVLCRLIGSENVSAVPIEKMHHRFQLAPTMGKLLNVASETAPSSRVDDALFKKFTSGEPVPGEFKRKDTFFFKPTARILVAMNERAAIKDYSDGTWRRILLVPWNYQVPENRVIRDLGNKIAESEMPGILCWAVEGIKRLYTQGYFTEGEVVRKATADFREERDPARTAILSCIRKDPDGFIPSQDIWNVYRSFCHNRDMPVTIQSTPTLMKAIKRFFPEIEPYRKRIDHLRVRGWKGISLTELATDEFDATGYEKGISEASQGVYQDG